MIVNCPTRIKKLLPDGFSFSANGDARAEVKVKAGRIVINGEEYRTLTRRMLINLLRQLDHTVLECGRYKYNCDTREVFLDNERLGTLRRGCGRIMRQMMENDGRIEKDTLVRQIGRNNMYVHISHLRKVVPVESRGAFYKLG
jgi:DNA-binding response OmpR family regulator